MSELPPTWAWTTLGEIAIWGSGGTPRAGDTRFYGGQVPWAVIGDLNDGVISTTAATLTEEGLAHSSAKVVPAGTVLMAMYGSIGKLGVAGTALATNQAIAFALPSAAVEPHFLFWFLRHERNALGAAGKGATQKNISQTVIRPWPIPLPPLAEQRRIVAAIEEQVSRLESAAHALQSAQTRLLAARKAVLAAAFADFGDSRPLADLTDPTRPICYGILKPKTAGESVVPYVEVRSIREGRVDLESLHRTTLALHQEFARSTLKPGDVVMAIRGSWDRAAVVPSELDGANVSRDVARIAPLPDLDSRFLAHFLASPTAARYFSRVARGVGVRGVNIADLRAIPVPYPARAEQEATVERIETVHVALTASARSVTLAEQRSQALRRSILAHAFRGELVPQDPDDEPASVLLERIAAERAATPRPVRKRREKATASA